ncbi:DUF6114 domain-containing protein [Halorientalis pallida]|uniref:Uncharacterized protein n=1 Tax=Halorientalis pallida TaxID=2479928 RepID=A0A498KZC3_9EURY|nr:DUF6114 domain-containing protein [Halorientalis pallida]RXK46280.1 hypothetical protein EAF64_19575 [Halorientalis pallida]
MVTSSGDGSSVRDWLADPRGAFRRWRRPRPMLGSALLLLGAAIIGWVPIQFAAELLFVGGAFTIVGLFFASLVAFCGLAALAKPEFASIFGVFGIAFATLSLVGALGGFFVGMIVATAGGVLCYAWEPPAESGVDVKTVAEASEFIWGGTSEFIWGGTSGFIWGKTSEFIWQTDEEEADEDDEAGGEDDLGLGLDLSEADGASTADAADADDEIETGDLDDRFKF